MSQQQQKRPKTIHRCILQRTSPNEEQQQRRGGMGVNTIDCHVCGSRYESYANYYTHLLDEACVQRRESRGTDHNDNRKRTVQEVKPKVRLVKKLRVKQPSEASNITNLCPHFAEATQTSPISLNEFLSEQTVLATLKVQLATLLAGLMGEEKLTALGYPDKDILFVLKTVLEMAKCQVVEANAFCTSVCQKLETVLAPTQVKYRKQKCELSAARLNIGRLLEICLPDQHVWKHQHWSEKPIEDILNQIIQSGVSV